MTSCKAMADEKLEAAFGAVLSGDFTSEEFRIANRHLGVCESCRREYAALSAFRPKLRDAYGLKEDAARRMGRRGRIWGGLAVAASLLVGLAVWHSAPDVAVLTAAPQAVATTVASSAGRPTAPRPGAQTAPFPERFDAVTISTADEMGVNMDEITDAELDQLLYELGV